MENNGRRQEIIRLLNDQPSIKVQDLIERFSVTPVTIRKDLARLENAGLISRTHGEAHLVSPAYVPPLGIRKELHAREKNAIARAASALVGDGDSVILDSGTTTLAIAKCLEKKKGITIITNSIPVSYFLADSGLCVLMCGGTLQGNSISLVGPEAEHYFSQITANILFLGATGIRDDFGLMISSSFESSLKQQMIKAAKKVYAVLDASKFSRTSIIQFATFKDVYAVITN